MQFDSPRLKEVSLDDRSPRRSPPLFSSVCSSDRENPEKASRLSKSVDNFVTDAAKLDRIRKLTRYYNQR